MLYLTSLGLKLGLIAVTITWAEDYTQYKDCVVLLNKSYHVSFFISTLYVLQHSPERYQTDIKMKIGHIFLKKKIIPAKWNELLPWLILSQILNQMERSLCNI